MQEFKKTWDLKNARHIDFTVEKLVNFTHMKAPGQPFTGAKILLVEDDPKQSAS